DRITQARFLAKHNSDVPGVRLAAIMLERFGIEWQPRNHGDAVIALLAVERDVFIAEPPEALERKAVVGTFGFLQAQHIWADGLEKSCDEIDAQPDRIDVPGGHLQLHRITSFESGIIRVFRFRLSQQSRGPE